MRRASLDPVDLDRNAVPCKVSREFAGTQTQTDVLVVGDGHDRGHRHQQGDRGRRDQLHPADGRDHFNPNASCRCAGSTPSNVQNVVAGGHATVNPNATGTTLFVLGMMVTAFAMRALAIGG